MPAERVDYYSDEEFQQAQQMEEQQMAEAAEEENEQAYAQYCEEEMKSNPPIEKVAEF